jgi:cobalt-precorrin-5B (C1)-methyltransferase
MIDRVVLKDQKALRRGFTTGTCAAAAAKAAAEMLFKGKEIQEVEVELPGGGTASLPITDPQRGDGWAACCVIKDAGDDPDVTHQALICARVEESEEGDLTLLGDQGIGRVTKPGLPVPIGEAAINPIPRQMILQEVQKVLPPGAGATITLSVPKGEELARRTMNPKLGIVGGISILGTTGIVEPMSEEAFKASLSPQIDVSLALGYQEPVLTPGRIGERHARERGIPEDAIVEVSNFIGFMLQECRRKGVKRVLLFGHIGKLVKVAAGIFYTHSKVADARMETLASHAAASGASRKTVRSILEANTTEEVTDILQENGLSSVFYDVAERAAERAQEHVAGEIRVATVLIDREGRVLGRSKEADESQWAGYLS